MKKLLLILSLSIITSNVFANEVTTTSCEEYGANLNSVQSMKTYANKSIKIFEIDMIEPAIAPVGVAIAIDRGDDLSTLESFCRYVPGLSSANIASAKSIFNQATNVLKVTMKVTTLDFQGNSHDKTLILTIDKGASSEDNLVKAILR